MPIPALAPVLLRFLDAPSRVEGKRDATGALRVPARIARAGVQTYWEQGKPINVLRPEAEVFSPETLASFEAVPLTLEHPVEGVVDSANYRTQTRGAVSNVRPDPASPGWVAASVLVQDAEAIAAVEGGKVQLSCGYTALRTSHNPPTPYTDSQGRTWEVHATLSGIRGNHVALTDAARAGPGARLILDSTTVCVATEDSMDPKIPAVQADGSCEGATTGTEAVPVVKVDHAAVLDSLKAEHTKVLDALTEKLAALKSANEKLAAELVTATSTETLARLVSERAAVLDVAKAHGVVTDSLSTEAVRSAVVAKAMPALKLEGFSAPQVRALFDSLPAVSVAPAPKTETTTTVAAPTPSPVDAARLERLARLGF